MNASNGRAAVGGTGVTNRADAQRAAFARGFTVSFFELDTSVPDALVKRETISILSAFPLRTALRPEAVSRSLIVPVPGAEKARDALAISTGLAALVVADAGAAGL
jgi:hypothetical protein